MVVDVDGVLVVGRTRREAALKLGWSDGPVHLARNLTRAQIRAYRLADNRTNEEAEWDKNLLSLEMEDLKLGGFDLKLTGFNVDECKLLLAFQHGTKEPDSERVGCGMAQAQGIEVWVKTMGLLPG